MKTGRRAFLGGLAAAPVGLAPAAVPLPPAPAPAAPAGLEAVAEALAEAVKRRHGAHLDAEELQAVKKKLLANLERAERLGKAARLGNADEPVARFQASPPAAKGARP